MRIAKNIFWLILSLSYACIFLFFLAEIKGLSKIGLYFAITWVILNLVSLTLLLSNLSIRFLPKIQVALGILAWLVCIIIPFIIISMAMPN